MVSSVSAETAKVVSLNYDDSSSVVYINVAGASAIDNAPQKYIRLETPNRIYFDIEDAILAGSKQQLVFDKSDIKEIKLAQFSTNPNVVRAVITFEENFDTSKVKLLNLNGNILVQVSTPMLKNDYFNPIYDESPGYIPYSSIVVNSQVIQKVAIPRNLENSEKNSSASEKVLADIQKAFADSTLTNSDGKTYESAVSVDLSSDLKLRTKYFINGYYLKNGGLLVSGLGQMSAAKVFTLDSPKRLVIDLPNTYVDKRIRNKDVLLCANSSCKDTAKIGQFDYNKARIVVTTETPEKYIPIYSSDSQSMLLINADKLDHTALVSNVANVEKAYVKKLGSNSSELILSFTSPVVHSIVRSENNLVVYMFNVKSYNGPDITKTLNGSLFKSMSLSLLPQVGVKSAMRLGKDDVVQVYQSVDGKAMKFVITGSGAKDINEPSQDISDIPVEPKKPPIKNKVVIDPGHGGTDYGAIREGINEKDITLDISQRVAAMLKARGYKVALTRTEDKYLELQERCDYTDAENPEIFVSIHVNSAVATAPCGIETHYYHDNSKNLADIIQKHLIKDINAKDRGVIRSKFYVINHTDVPAVLVETGFMSNPEERAELITEKRKQMTAKAITDGIIEYLKKNK